jgi:hypothetical protein
VIKFKFGLCFLLTLPALAAAQQADGTLRPAVPISASSDLPEEPQPQMAAMLLVQSTPAQSTTDQSSSAQQQTSAPAQATAPAQTPQQDQRTQKTDEDKRAQAQKQLEQEEHQRMLGVIPNFNEVLGGEAEPLTPGQKFHLFFKGSIDPYQFFIAGIDAGIEQAEDEYPSYNQGALGLLRRFGASYADSFDGNFWGNAVLPSLLHQDPRYFRLGHGTFKHRLWYSMISTVRAKSDAGKWQPNYSNVIGNFIGGAISNVYYPAVDRGVALTLERGITVTGEGTFGAFLEEFYPDYVSWRQHRKERKAAAAAAAANATPTP